MKFFFSFLFFYLWTIEKYLQENIHITNDKGEDAIYIVHGFITYGSAKSPLGWQLTSHQSSSLPDKYKPAIDNLCRV